MFQQRFASTALQQSPSQLTVGVGLSSSTSEVEQNYFRVGEGVSVFRSVGLLSVLEDSLPSLLLVQKRAHFALFDPVAWS